MGIWGDLAKRFGSGDTHGDSVTPWDYTCRISQDNSLCFQCDSPMADNLELVICGRSERLLLTIHYSIVGVSWWLIVWIPPKDKTAPPRSFMTWLQNSTHYTSGPAVSQRSVWDYTWPWQSKGDDLGIIFSHPQP